MTAGLFKLSPLLIAFAVAVSLPPGAESSAAQEQEKEPGQSDEWPPRTADRQPDIQGVWGGAEFGTWTVWLENTSYLYSIGMSPLNGTSRGETPVQIPGALAPIRETALYDPPDGILPYRPWALERRNSVMRDYLRPEPWQMDTQTPGWPSGIPRENAYSSPDGFYGGPIQILQSPGSVVFLYETHHEFRVVPLDGRPQPGDDIKLWLGSSRGRWDGNTLVIDVMNNNDSPRLSVIGDFRSDQMRATERWTFADQDTLEYRATIDDPMVFTRPWTMGLTFKRTPPGTELLEYAGVEGTTGLTTIAK